MKYFISYVAADEKGLIVYGNFEIERDKEIANYSDIADIQQEQENILGFENVTIINWRLF